MTILRVKKTVTLSSESDPKYPCHALSNVVGHIAKIENYYMGNYYRFLVV